VFDQPNLKATFTLALTVPPGWQAMANAPGARFCQQRRQAGTFATSGQHQHLLFSFAAGGFSRLNRVLNWPMSYRETDLLSMSLGHLWGQMPSNFHLKFWLSNLDSDNQARQPLTTRPHAVSGRGRDAGRVWRYNLVSHERPTYWFGDLANRTVVHRRRVWMKGVRQFRWP
jgi:aminopeptidase N